MKPYILSLTLGLMACFSLLQAPGCIESQASTKGAIDIPELLARNEAVGNSEEQTKIRSTYDQLVYQLTQKPSLLKPKLQLARLFMLEARATGEHGYYYPAALDLLQPIAKQSQDPNAQLESRFLLSSVYMSLHQFDKGLELAKQAQLQSPKLAGLYGPLVDGFVEMGDYEKAIEMADKMVELRPDLRSYSRVSYLRELHGLDTEAIEAMEMAVEAGVAGQEDAAWCRLMLGGLYENQGDLQMAEMQYRMLLEERKDYPFAYAALAGVEQKKGRLEEAESILKKACNIIPEVGFYMDLAGLYDEMGRNGEKNALIAEIEDMLADDEQSGHIMDLTYVELYLELAAEPEKALPYAIKEYEARPRNIDVNQMLAQVYYAMGQTELAAAHMAPSMRLGSQNARLLCLAGLVQYESGNVDAARNLLSDSFIKDPYQNHSLASQGKEILSMLK